jgi:hypothetical protein
MADRWRGSADAKSLINYLADNYGVDYVPASLALTKIRSGPRESGIELPQEMARTVGIRTIRKDSILCCCIIHSHFIAIAPGTSVVEVREGMGSILFGGFHRT